LVVCLTVDNQKALASLFAFCQGFELFELESCFVLAASDVFSFGYSSGGGN